jgi:hypothetical protein
MVLNEYDMKSGKLDPSKKRTIDVMKEGAFGDLNPNKLVEDKLAIHAADYLKNVIEAKYAMKKSFVEIINNELIADGGGLENMIALSMFG